MKNKNFKIIRKGELAHKIIFVDGLAGCGKTMLSSIVSAMDRVELLNYAFEIEFICRLNFLSKLDNDAAIAMVRMMSDHKIYQNMMGRDVNFRYSDLSSAFQNHNPFRYFKRIFQEGDMVVPDRIMSERPILNFTTHDLLQVGKPVFLGLKDRLAFLHVVRHPLFMIIQQTLNMERLLNNSRDIQICFEHKGNEIPYFGYGWEDLFLKSNAVEKSIYSIKQQLDLIKKFKKDNSTIIENSILTIPFEKFVKNPNEFIKDIERVTGTKFIKSTYKSMKKQKVPRKNVVDGIPLSIYKRCGWEPPEKSLSEKEEYLKRRQFAINQGASQKAMEVLDEISYEYEQEFNI